MTQEHPITPPLKLFRKWTEYRGDQCEHQFWWRIATQAARWGADQQLAEDAKWLDHHALNEAHIKTIPVGDLLKEAMRPKPPILKEQALDALNLVLMFIPPGDQREQGETIRRALEQLDD